MNKFYGSSCNNGFIVDNFPRIIRIHASNAIKKIEDKIEERLGLDDAD